MPPVKSFGERIVDVLVEDSLLTSKQVAEILELQKKEGTRLLELLLKKSYVTDLDMAVAMGRVLNIPPINLAHLNIPLEVANLLPREIAHNHKVVPVSRLENKLFLAMANPLNVLARDDVRDITRMEVAMLIAPEKAIQDKLAQIDAVRGGSIEDIIQDAQKKAIADEDADNVEVSREAIEEVNLDELAASTEEAPVIKLANLILVQAVKDRASDVHIEPFDKTLRLRYRIDGVLVDATPPPKQMQLALVSRFKIMSSLDIAERRQPQDGRMRIRVGGKDYDLRVSIMPTVHGEKVVLRLLDKANLSASIDKLGLDPDTFQQFKTAIDAPHGLILVTGPTGSGKTTTLYSALNELNDPVYNIVTVEDPVEFQIPGINQVPTKKEIGLTFANVLRSILRQDPDIIMIGEIRDTETAEIAIEAALTGHQVLSTMHCNDAPGAITRLDDMGIAPFLISSSVILACAQRLMRRICSHCKEPVTYPAKMYQDLNIDPSIFDGVTLYRGRGCERCKNSGYAGRMAIIEAMTISDEIRKLIIARANSREIGKVAIGQGMRTLRMVALDRAQEGISTLEQVLVLTSTH
ncbi:MAG: Flp pilus assembly complex ATPase component TadA [Verrucomicrobia bacterium]|jgi:type IV pilus assembly protein PilB|nr:Flp pilus assembly complex ATPase component TadA [Verrucomicrobiota bacterium]OQC27073.1 MAG: Type II secretion system protein E [Verrucomicrobia bacterium ADurb.Bin063]MBP8014117.1 Flp pilus assembly complex ATPase component TadA [Verrucomicrobiota bacterium]HNW06396.1 ATPase, T2SS/T4P/T4SS family [Verrucomicrobiota bacterium]HNZ74736.1 ATPase, T2SS/T4P/T4SS family [Verrucomicrobiota bacterium]